MSFKRKSKEKNWSGNSGQAVLETVLVLLVVVSMARLVWGLNQSVQEWGFNYFGDYFSCLIDVGELPSLGSSVEGECSGAYQAYTFANGRPPLGGSGGGGSGSGGNGGLNESSGASSGGGGGGGDSGGSSANNGSADSGNGGRGNRTRVGSSNFRNSGANQNRSNSAGTAGNEEEDDKFKVERGSGIPDWALNNKNSKESGRPERQSVNKKFVLEGEAEDRGREQIKTSSGKVSLNEDEDRSKKIKIKERKPAEVKAADDEGVGFGRLLRMLIILGIIIAIMVFFGGQALQISKDSE